MWRAWLCILALEAAPAVAAETCITPPYTAAEASTPGEMRLAGLVAEVAAWLQAYPSLAETMQDGGAEICLAAPLAGAQGYFVPDTPRIVVKDGLPDALALGILLHEIRHFDQLRRGACVPPGLAMSDHARAVAAMEADASAVSLLVAWDLRAQGDDRVWNALAAWPDQADIAAALRAAFEAGADPAEAVARAFAQWFAKPDRVFDYYRASCADYLEQQERQHALTAVGRLEAGYLDALCRLPDGAGYACGIPDGPR